MPSPYAHVVHALACRVHVRAPALSGHPDAMARVARTLAEDPAHERVSARPWTGSIVIEREDGAACAGPNLDAEGIARRVSDLVAAERAPDGHPLTAHRPERHPGPTRVAHAVAHAAREINTSVSEALDHRADLATLLPVAFAAGGFAEIAATGKLPVPSWFNLVWWSLRSFMTFNAGAVAAEAHCNGAPIGPDDLGPDLDDEDDDAS